MGVRSRSAGHRKNVAEGVELGQFFVGYSPGKYHVVSDTYGGRQFLEVPFVRTLSHDDVGNAGHLARYRGQGSDN